MAKVVVLEAYDAGVVEHRKGSERSLFMLERSHQQRVILLSHLCYVDSGPTESGAGAMENYKME